MRGGGGGGASKLSALQQEEGAEFISNMNNVYHQMG